MASKSQAKKLEKKLHKAQMQLIKKKGIGFTDTATPLILLVGAGLGNDVSYEALQEQILDEWQAHIDEVIMPPHETYSIVLCKDAESGQKVQAAVHGRVVLTPQLPTRPHVVLKAAFATSCPEFSLGSSPGALAACEIPGLHYVPEFLSGQEEQELVDYFMPFFTTAGDASFESSLRHRQVCHFGYEFLYRDGQNTVDPSAPLLDRPLPLQCETLWQRCVTLLAETNPALKSWHPDQLTVNFYLPGQGIPPHVDSHSPFTEPLLSVSLLSNVMMELARVSPASQQRTNLWMERRSCLLLLGEARYAWSHGIVPRRSDLVPRDSQTGHDPAWTRVERQTRMSLTFRQVKQAPFHCLCVWKDACDAPRTEKSPGLPSAELSAEQLEERYVHTVYDAIAEHFSETRRAIWPSIGQFLEQQVTSPRPILGLDLGCGNGKYMRRAAELRLPIVGLDRSRGLCDICRERGFSALVGDALHLPFHSGRFTFCICIAVVHHLSTVDRRTALVKEALRILQPGGHLLLTVWARDQKRMGDGSPSSYLKQKSRTGDPKGHTIRTCGAHSDANNLPVHANRTEFAENDMLVPWKKKNPVGHQEDHSSVAVTGETFLRYYHLFEENELEQLVQQFHNVTVTRRFYEEGNWGVVVQKLS